MEFTGIAVIAIGLIAFGLISKRLEGTIITVPLVFVLFGWLIGGGGLGVATINPGHGAIHAIAELTLILVLFSDAARIDVRRLSFDHNLPARMLLVGLPLTIICGALTAKAIFPELIWPAAFLLAAVLAPTDAALGQSVVSSPNVPVRIRQALNVESGVNDGIALPIVLVCAIWAGAPAEHAQGATDLALFAALQVILGPLAGIAVGFAGAKLIDRASQADWMSEPFQGMAILAIAVLAFVGAELIGGNGFIAAFAAGLTFGGALRHPCKFLFEFMETEGQLLTILTFLIFGAAMLPEALHALSWPVAIYALMSLTFVRLIPVALSLSQTGLSTPSKLFLGWFGPRGLASILFALLILETYPVDAGESILACVILTVALSTLLHGVSAAPLARVYGALVARSGECEERQPVSEMPVRHGTAFDRLFARKSMNQ
jgi:NhaP-type Na+/H+ or K+/H+ antiporter